MSARPSRNPGAAERAQAALLASPYRGNQAIAAEAGCSAQTVWVARRELEGTGQIPRSACGSPAPRGPRPSPARHAIAAGARTPREVADAAHVSIQAAWKMLRAIRRSGISVATCQGCGEVFTYPARNGLRRSYCTRACQAARSPGRDETPVPSLPPPPDWSRGLCTTVKPHMRAWWTSSARDEREAAARYCQRCPVLAACERWSLALPWDDDTVYAGLDRTERNRRKRAVRDEITRQALEGVRWP